MVPILTHVDTWTGASLAKEQAVFNDTEAHAFFEPYGEWKALAYHFYKWREAETEYRPVGIPEY